MVESRRTPRVTIENARILPGPFKNFAGRGDQYNREGVRFLHVEIPADLVERMQNDGWNIRFLDPREEGDLPTPILKVEVSFNPKATPPEIYLVKRFDDPDIQDARTRLDEGSVETLDYMPMRNVDLIIHPYAWDVNGKTCIKAYLHKMFITVDTDGLDAKHADVPEGRQSPVHSGGPRFSE